MTLSKIRCCFSLPRPRVSIVYKRTAQIAAIYYGLVSNLINLWVNTAIQWGKLSAHASEETSPVQIAIFLSCPQKRFSLVSVYLICNKNTVVVVLNTLLQCICTWKKKLKVKRYWNVAQLKKLEIFFWRGGSKTLKLWKGRRLLNRIPTGYEYNWPFIWQFSSVYIICVYALAFQAHC